MSTNLSLMASVEYVLLYFHICSLNIKIGLTLFMTVIATFSSMMVTLTRLIPNLWLVIDFNKA